MKRRGGPPRKVENVTGSSGPYARAIALALAGVKERDGTFAVRGKVFMELDEDDGVIGGGDEVRLRTIPRDDVCRMVLEAWRAVAPKGSSPPERGRAITVKDVRKIVLSLPGVQELPSGGTPAWCAPDKRKKGLFARMGPGIGNLLPPDDKDTLYIATGPEDALALLEMHADRFFITPHYVGWGVLTRLSENSRADRQELAEILTDAWRRKAPAKVVEAFDVRP